MKKHWKKLAVAVSLCAAAANAYAAMSSAYVSQTQLIKAAKREYAQTNVYTIVNLDNVRIYDSGDGFSPASVYFYYTCRNGIIAQTCPPSTGGYLYF